MTAIIYWLDDVTIKNVIGVGYVASLFFPKPVIDKNLLYSGWVEGRRAEKATAYNASIVKG